MPDLKKPTCQCEEEMDFLAETERIIIWECPSCCRLLLKAKDTAYLRWYIPEVKTPIFTITSEDVIRCAKEIGITELAITPEVLARVSKAVEWGRIGETWEIEVEEAIKKATNPGEGGTAFIRRGSM